MKIISYNDMICFNFLIKIFHRKVFDFFLSFDWMFEQKLILSIGFEGSKKEIEISSHPSQVNVLHYDLCILK